MALDLDRNVDARRRTIGDDFQYLAAAHFRQLIHVMMTGNGQDSPRRSRLTSGTMVFPPFKTMPSRSSALIAAVRLDGITAPYVLDEVTRSQVRLGFAPSLARGGDIGTLLLRGVPGLFFTRQVQGEEATTERRPADQDAFLGEPVPQIVDRDVRRFRHEGPNAKLPHPPLCGACAISSRAGVVFIS